MAQPQGHFGYQNVRIIKTSSLGVGSYGAVYRALCNELPCAAKIIHPTLFETHDPGARKIMEQFEQECQFLSSVRHPHIVQYLGVSRDPDSGLPVLLMELMDSSLTQFLEQSEEPLPYHIQVDLCHDVALALVYLHVNGIIHRDLSSNNVLLIGPGNRAKVTDFGTLKLADANPRLTPMTMCPGTLVYMPPEALEDSPIYTNKLDCFSFGVLDIQILTRKFPDPSHRFKTMEIDDPRFPTGQIKVPVPEVERHQSHIEQVDPAHPLLPVALDCLKDRERMRPSAQELCHRLAALKETPQYGESVQRAQSARADESVRIREQEAAARDRRGEMEQLQQKLTQQIENLQQQIQEKHTSMETNEKQHVQQIENYQLQLRNFQQQLQDKDDLLTLSERQLQMLHQQLEATQQLTAHNLMQRIRELRQSVVERDQKIRELQLLSGYSQPESAPPTQPRGSFSPAEPAPPTQPRGSFSPPPPTQFEMPHFVAPRKRLSLPPTLPHTPPPPPTQFNYKCELQIRDVKQQSQQQQSVEPQVGVQSSLKGPLNLQWRVSRTAAPREVKGPLAVVDGSTAYFNSLHSTEVCVYDSKKQTWSTLPPCPHKYSSLAVINSLLTAIGGESSDNITNQLFSLRDERRWVERFPPMPTKRKGAAVVCSAKSLIVAGGCGESYTLLDTVEVMDTETLQWSTARRLPFPLTDASATTCQDHVYLMGYGKNEEPKSVLACSLKELLQSCQSWTLRRRLKRALSQREVWHRVASLPLHSATGVTLCGQLLAVGGKDDNSKRTTAVHQYNPVTDSWEVISHMSIPRSKCLVAVLPGNKLMVVGGRMDFSSGWTAAIVDNVVEIATV